MSRRAEPSVLAVDAFSIVWNDHLFYTFPPFGLVAKIFQRMEQDSTEVVVVIDPVWPTQASLLHMISGPCFLLLKPWDILSIPYKSEYLHPLKKIRLFLFRLSRKRSSVKVYQEKLRMLSSLHGETPLSENTIVTSKGGSFFVDKTEIQLKPTVNHILAFWVLYIKKG